MNAFDTKFLADVRIAHHDFEPVSSETLARLKQIHDQAKKALRHRQQTAPAQRPSVQDAVVFTRRDRKSMQEALAQVASYILNSGADSVTLRVKR
jgi:hypothetical protein